MKRSIYTIMLAALLGSISATSALAQSSPYFNWIDDYDTALAEAKQSGKPILLTFRCVP